MVALATLTLLIWLYLTFANGYFWKIDRDNHTKAPDIRPLVIVIIPARDEAENIGQTITSLFGQNYSELQIILVDDHSSVDTVNIALQAASDSNTDTNNITLNILKADPLPDGWSGKVWAMHQGVTRGLASIPETEFVLFSDADITHGPTVVRDLVNRCSCDNHDMASYMVRLSCETFAERLMIPAFVYFFRMLYPFRKVNARNCKLAGAAGGTILIKRSALDRIGGLESIKSELIDDCSLAAKVKAGGQGIWLGLSYESRSSRLYNHLGEIISMIARTAFTQLRYSWLQLTGCVAGLGVTFIAPPLLSVFGNGPAKWMAITAWLLMTTTYIPMVAFYRQKIPWALLLPLTAVIYLYATILSAIRHARGIGGLWKGRIKTI